MQFKQKRHISQIQAEGHATKYLTSPTHNCEGQPNKTIIAKGTLGDTRNKCVMVSGM